MSFWCHVAAVLSSAALITFRQRWSRLRARACSPVQRSLRAKRVVPVCMDPYLDGPLHSGFGWFCLIWPLLPILLVPRSCFTVARLMSCEYWSHSDSGNFAYPNRPSSAHSAGNARFAGKVRQYLTDVGFPSGTWRPAPPPVSPDGGGVAKTTI